MSSKKKEAITSLTFSSFNEDDSGELIQLIAPEDEEAIKPDSFPEELPILPIRNTVLFPGVVIPITVGRQKSIRLVKNSYRGDRIIGVVAQKNDKVEEPGFDDLYKVGTVARIVKMLVLPDGNTTIIIQGKLRFQLTDKIKEDPYLTARVKYLEDKFPSKNKKETKAILQSIKDGANKILKLNPEIPQEAQIAIDNIDSPSFLTHFLSSNLSADVTDKQKLLENEKEINEAVRAIDMLLDTGEKDRETIARLLGKVVRFNRFLPRTSAFEVLKSKDLTVISDVNLRQDIVEYYDEIAMTVIEGLADVELEFTQEWYPVLRREFIEFKFEQYAMPKKPQAFITDLSNVVFLRLAQDNRRGSGNQIANAIKKIDDILYQMEGR